jgi:hypothetical protein
MIDARRYVALANKMPHIVRKMWVNKEPYEADITVEKPPTLLRERTQDPSRWAPGEPDRRIG